MDKSVQYETSLDLGVLGQKQVLASGMVNKGPGYEFVFVDSVTIVELGVGGLDIYPLMDREMKDEIKTYLVETFNKGEAAKTLARIAGKKTLSVADLSNASALGLEVVEINRNYGPISDLAYGKAA